VVEKHMFNRSNPDEQNFWYAGNSKIVPTLGSVRGKIVLLSWGGTYGISPSFDWTSQWEISGVRTLEGVISKKWEGVEASLNKAQDTSITNLTWFATGTNATLLDPQDDKSDDKLDSKSQFNDGVNAGSIANGRTYIGGYHMDGINDKLSHQN